MTGLLSRMNSLGPTGKAAHKLAQHLTRALSASRPSSPTSAAGVGSGQFARFNSLLSAASGASSAATSPRSVHFGRAPQPSRLGSQAALQGSRSAALSRQQSEVGGLASDAGSPTAAATAAATAGGALSRQASLSSVLHAVAAEQQAGVAGAAEPDAAAWAQHFQQSQQVGVEGAGSGWGTTSIEIFIVHSPTGAAALHPSTGPLSCTRQHPRVFIACIADLDGWPPQRCLKHRFHAEHPSLPSHPSSLQGIADLQELLDLHRRYVQQASQDCLTWGGSEAARCAVEGALQCLLGFAFRLQVSRVLRWGSCGEVGGRLGRRLGRVRACA